MSPDRLRLGHDPGPNYPRRPQLTPEIKSDAESIRIAARERLHREGEPYQRASHDGPSYPEFEQLTSEQDAVVDRVLDRPMQSKEGIVHKIVDFVRRVR